MTRRNEGIMKKLTGYFICFTGLCVIFTTCYYLSYQRAMKQFLDETSERDYELMTQLQNIVAENNKNIQQEIAASSINNALQANEVVEVGVTDIETVRPDAKYILESYNVLTNQLLREELVLPNEYVGRNREDVIKYLSSYMSDVPISEHEKGLFAYELIDFANDKLIMRKSYNQDLVTFKYYVAVRDGYVVVYYSDLKTVYEYTRIIAVDLPEEERVRLMEGIYLDSGAELYELLESYSS